MRTSRESSYNSAGFDGALGGMSEGGMRPSPRLDYRKREALSSLAKWSLLIAGLLLFSFWAGVSRQQHKTLEGVDAPYYFVEHFLSVLLATLPAMAMPRFLFPRLRNRDEDPVSLLRNWMVAGFATAALFYASLSPLRNYAESQMLQIPFPYFAALNPIKKFNNAVPDANKLIDAENKSKSPDKQKRRITPIADSLSALKYMDDHNANIEEGREPDKNAKIYSDSNLYLYNVYAPRVWSHWLYYRMPLAILCALLGFLSVGLLSHREGKSVGATIGITLLQVALLAALLYGVMQGVRLLLQNAAAPYVLGALSALLFLFSAGVLAWAFHVDRGVRRLQREGKETGIAGEGMQLTLTMVGGASSGKTCFLAGAFRQWSEEETGRIKIKSNPQSGDSRNLESISDQLYSAKTFPLGNISCSHYGFHLMLGEQVVARFTILDYPGGVIAGDNPDPAAEPAFWKRVNQTDGVVLLADMSQIRRKFRYKDDPAVRRAYKDVLQKVALRNGANRVVPVALVLTKVDEYKDPIDEKIHYSDMRDGLEDYEYLALELHWTNLCKPPHGSGVVRFRRFFCSAIRRSSPHKDSDGHIDMKQPFGIHELYQPKPEGCLAPLLWICANAMRWNVTLYDDLAGWLWGGSRKARKRMEAILELEALANSMATKIYER